MNPTDGEGEDTHIHVGELGSKLVDRGAALVVDRPEDHRGQEEVEECTQTILVKDREVRLLEETHEVEDRDADHDDREEDREVGDIESAKEEVVDRKDNDDCEHHEQALYASLALLRSGCRVGHRLADISEALPAGHVLRESNEHADACKRKAQVPVDLLADVSHDERGEQGAEVDAHVEDREATIAAGVAGGIEVANHRAHTRLQ